MRVVKFDDLWLIYGLRIDFVFDFYIGVCCVLYKYKYLNNCNFKVKIINKRKKEDVEE